MIDNDICKAIETLKINSPENFYKLLMFCVSMAGEGIIHGNCDAGDLVYSDVLGDYCLDWERLETLANEFTENYMRS